MTTKQPGQRIARHIHKGITVLLPHTSGRPGMHNSYVAMGEPYEDGGEWWVEVRAYGDDEVYPIALWEASLPI